MTLRDYFAGQALAGIMNRGTFGPGDASGFAHCAYLIADAMLAAREAPND